MKHYLRFLRQTALHATSVGVLTGGVFAVREIALQQYLAQYLWRAAMRTLCHYTLVGALFGVGGAIFLVLWLCIWQVRPETRGPISERREGDPSARLTGLFAVCAVAAILLTPNKAPQVLGVSHWYAVAAAVALVWVIVSSYLADTAEQGPENDTDPAGFGLLWYQFVGLSLVVAVSHIWARSWPVWVTGFLMGVSLLGSTAVFRLLYRPARDLTLWLEGATAAAARVGTRHIPTVVVAMVTALWLAGWIIGIQTRAQASASGMNVIVIAVDTLRWDAVSLLDPDEHERDLTPHLRRGLAARASVFSRAYSQAPWTLPPVRLHLHWPLSGTTRSRTRMGPPGTATRDAGRGVARAWLPDDGGCFRPFCDQRCRHDPRLRCI